MNEEPEARQNQDGIHGGITVEVAWNTGKALADWLPMLGSVVMTSPDENEIAHAVIEGLRLQGRTVIMQVPGDIGVASARITAEHLAGGVVIEPGSIVLLDSNGARIENEALSDVQNLIVAGNFMPADVRGELVI